MGYIIEVPFPLDIFDAATNRCLPGYEHGVVDFKREQTTLGSVIYHLRQEQLGNLGSIEIHKIHPEITEVHFIDPPMPNDQEAIQYLAKTKLADKVNLFQEITKLIDSNAPISLVALVACELVQPEKVAQRNNKHGATDWYLALPKDEARPLIDSVNRALRDARNTFHAKRKEHYRLVLEAFENRLHDDGAMEIKHRQITEAPSNPQFRQLLDKHFNESELRNLCFDLEVDYENLPGDTKGDKARELVAYMIRHGREEVLNTEIQKLRPKLK